MPKHEPVESPYQFEVSDEEGGKRLDLFIVMRLENTSRTTVQKWIRDSSVTVNGEICRASYKLAQGDQVLVQPPPAEPPDLVAEEIPLELLYEDEILLVVNIVRHGERDFFHIIPKKIEVIQDI